MINQLSPVKKINSTILNEKEIELFIKRDDMIHPIISGNKYRKLKYSIKYMKENNISTAITFGGAYSNHIHAASYAFKESEIQLVCIIRGEELAYKKLNKTLQFAKDNNANLVFINRSEYQMRNNPSYLQELEKYYNGFVIPEGGSNEFSKFGLKELVMEINNELDIPDFICCATGTGGTIAGICFGAEPNQTIIGINAVKGNTDDITNFINYDSNHANYQIFSGYEFGGYAKHNETLMNFIKSFNQNHEIQLEQVYTGKMMFGLFDLIKNDYFKKGSEILSAINYRASLPEAHNCFRIM